MINLKEIRKSRKLTQKELANLLGIKQQQYARYESRVNKITLETFLKILEICGFTFEIKKKEETFMKK